MHRKRRINKGFEYLTKLDLNVIIDKVKYILSLNNKDDIDFNNQLYMLKNSYYDKGKEITEYEDEYWKNIIQTSGDDTFTIDGKYGPERKTLVLVMQGKTCSTFFKSLIDTDIRNVAVFKRVPNPQSDKTWNEINEANKNSKKKIPQIDRYAVHFMQKTDLAKESEDVST